MEYKAEEYVKLIGNRLSEYRFHHSMCVADAAVKLAEKYGANIDDAYVAGVLHDVMKEASAEEQLKEIKKADIIMTDIELGNKKLYHQMSGAAFVKCELDFDNEDVINAIRYHTTGRANMSLLEKIIYLADYISDDRTYDDVEKMREETEKSIKDGMLFAMRYTIMDLAKNSKTIHPDTVNAYNEVVSK